MRRILLPLLAVTVAGCGGPRDVTVPSNHGHTLDDALRRLHASGLRATFPGAAQHCRDTSLPQVSVQSPRAPARVRHGSVVSMRLQVAPLASPVIPLHPRAVYSVPAFVGQAWPPRALNQFRDTVVYALLPRSRRDGDNGRSVRGRRTGTTAWTTASRADFHAFHARSSLTTNVQASVRHAGAPEGAVARLRASWLGSRRTPSGHSGSASGLPRSSSSPQRGGTDHLSHARSSGSASATRGSCLAETQSPSEADGQRAKSAVQTVNWKSSSPSGGSLGPMNAPIKSEKHEGSAG